jgi:sugar lactone lactonase YvrE
LIENGADVQDVDGTGATPLILALLNRHTDLALVLLEHDANVNEYSRIDSQLLKHVVDDDIPQERLRVTPLIVAALMGDARIMSALFNRGAAVAARGEEDMTALHAAALAGNVDAARLLIERGAPLDVTLTSGETALELAQAKQHADVAELLRLAAGDILAGPIDVARHLAIAATRPWQVLDGIRSWDAVPIGLAVGSDGSVYWTQYRTGSIHRVSAAGGDVETLAVIDGVLGLAFDDERDLLFYVADGHYPRSVGSLRPGSEPRELVYGTAVNRPFAIAVAAEDGRIYWTESINGRIRAMQGDGTGLVGLYDDGIASQNERPGAVAMSPAGIAVDSRRGILFWSDLLSGTIVRANVDGEERRIILGLDQGLDSPTGLAVDSKAGKLYWADLGTQRISRANLDGSHAEVIASAEEGVLEPYGLAVDSERGLLYWTDLARNGIWRAVLDDKQVEPFVDLGDGLQLRAGDTDDLCGAATARVRDDFLSRRMKSVRTCLIKVAAIKAVKRHARDMRRAAATCAHEFGLAHDTTRVRRALLPDCDEERLNRALDEMRQQGAEVVAADLPRAAEWLQEVRPFIIKAGEPDATSARQALEEVDDLLRRMATLAPPTTTKRAWTLPASGQTTRYGVLSQGNLSRPTPVPDDGTVRAGSPLAFVDNGDGTTTDLNTGLMWEKKCDGCAGLHNVDKQFAWNAEGEEPTVSAWLQSVNAENGAGFAGYQDWRIPVVSELMGIVDYERFNPAVNESFASSGCGLGCSSPRLAECSCTRLDKYWTSTPNPAKRGEMDELVVVTFNLGLVFGVAKDQSAFVRAVRGPRPEVEPRFVDNGDGTITDRLTRLVWEKKCDCHGELHHFAARFAWSHGAGETTIWKWLDALNGEGNRGFAGHRDWRVPNIKELATLLDHSRASPNIFPIFVQGKCAAIGTPRCSWTEPGLHWSSTTFADFPAHALTVEFRLGYVDDRVKSLRLAARAVRGPIPAVEGYGPD